jgi:hypothetical protein
MYLWGSVDTVPIVTIPEINWRPWGDVVLEGYSMRLKPSCGQGGVTAMTMQLILVSIDENASIAERKPQGNYLKQPRVPNGVVCCFIQLAYLLQLDRCSPPAPEAAAFSPSGDAI